MNLKICTLIMVLAIAASATPAKMFQTPDAISGEWKVTFSIQGQTADGVLKLKLAGESVTGTIDSAHTGAGTLTNGKWAKNKLSFTMEFAKHESIAVTGTVKDGKLQGEFATEGTTGTWTASKN